MYLCARPKEGAIARVTGAMNRCKKPVGCCVANSGLAQ